jgi:hypothetical protein
MPLTRRTLPFMLTAIAIAATCRGAESPESALNRLIKPYSSQQIVWLDVQESFTFKLANGDARAIRLISVEDSRDSVVNFVRRSDVRVEIDGRPLDLVSMPFVMPTEIGGLRIQADTTSGYGNISKRVQLSLWDAAHPIVDTKRFVFPLRNFRLLSHGVQAYNEPVHLGAGDGDPAGQLFYHDYGFDMGGFENGQTVVSPIAGKIALFWPSREDLCSVVVEDANGLNWELAHLHSVGADIVLGRQVAAGQTIGVLGKSGPSGNFSHLHLGTYLNKHDLDGDNRNRRLNLYSWLVAAYQAEHPQGILAVARPHHVVLTGEKVLLDGSNSLVWNGNKIVQWRWVLPDGRKIDQAKAEAAFYRPGAYIATLWIKDDHGNEDVDFCQVKVYSKDHREKGMPHIYMSSTPTEDIRPDQPVRFRFWNQGNLVGPVTVAFDDGTKIENYKPYTEFSHRFKTPGIHVVTSRCDNEGKRIEQKLKIVVARDK